MTTATEETTGTSTYEEAASRICVLDALPAKRLARVVRVTAPAQAPEWAQWLTEIGFLPGEPVVILARGRPGGDPLVVRIGDSTFALRRAEAACVEVAADPAGDERGA